jgi:hypothetical protein
VCIESEGKYLQKEAKKTVFEEESMMTYQQVINGIGEFGKKSREYCV